MRSFYFNAKPTTDLISHPTGYDRVYDAADRAEYHAPEATDGIFAVTNDACQAYVVEGNIIGVKAGYANYRGYRCHVEGDETIAATSSGYVVLRWDNTEAVRAFVLALTPALVDTDVIHDLALAQVTVESGVVTAIVDKREWVQWTRLPPYYPPDSDAVPISLWRYIIGLPMTEDEIAQVESSPELMEIYGNSKLTAAGRYGLKFEGRRANSGYKVYTNQVISSGGSQSSTSENARAEGTIKFSSMYDPLNMLGADGVTFTVPASVHKIKIRAEGKYNICEDIGLGGNAFCHVKKGDTIIATAPTRHLSSSATEYECCPWTLYVDVNPGDQIYLYASVSSTTYPSGSTRAACVEIDELLIEVVE